MVLCAECNVWQHAVCFALLSEDEVPETHICVQCSQVHCIHTHIILVIMYRENFDVG